ncbi:DinB family protein [Catenuloplanes indicus]|uniref:Mini-circle protein n=1 Tax=Catenuloplanes indicus TaxID=137267 RepID=A0AAE3W3G1_9ACTN|nr:DinB family protein [Catenuloplanes indicus]MDQ0368841.1 hypothetical protein [Catenuloplanes indicus]
MTAGKPSGGTSGIPPRPPGTTTRDTAVAPAPAVAGPRRRPRTRDVGPGWTDPGETATLRGFLDYLRNSVVEKVADVPEPEVRAAGVPSGTSLLGLVKHLTAVERFYFLGEPITNLRRTMRPARGETVEGLIADYRRAVAEADEVIDGWTDLAGPAPRPPGRGLPPTQRWVLTHMIEETARHAGHADIIREQIDGSTGR